MNQQIVVTTLNTIKVMVEHPHLDWLRDTVVNALETLKLLWGNEFLNSMFPEAVSMILGMRG